MIIQITECFLCARYCSKCFTYIMILNLHSILESKKMFKSHDTDEGTEVQKGH